MDAQKETQGKATQSGGFSRLAQAQKKEVVTTQGEAAARRSLNALGVTSGLVSALIQYPGPKGDHESMVGAARTMLHHADRTTQDLLRELSLDVLPWAQYRVMRMVCGAVSDQWCATAKADGNPSADVSSLIPVWKEMASHELPNEIFEDPAEDNRTALQIALLDAMRPVMHEISKFDLFHDPKKAALHAKDLILSASSWAIKELAQPGAPDRSKHLLMHALMRNGGMIYASAWKRQAEDTIDELMNMTPSQQASVASANPDGISLEGVDRSFVESFRKLVEMVNFLGAPKQQHEAAPATGGSGDDSEGRSSKPQETVVSF